MSISLEDQRVVVIVFAMGECGACEHYLPRLVAEAEALTQKGYPFVVNPESTPPNEAIPILLYDAASADAEVQKLADRFGVTATPTTIIAARGPGSFKAEGSLANNQIQWVLMMAQEARKQ
jgi:thiol-disulfide isomerase/thioredoxin